MYPDVCLFFSDGMNKVNKQKKCRQFREGQNDDLKLKSQNTISISSMYGQHTSKHSARTNMKPGGEDEFIYVRNHFCSTAEMVVWV